MDMFRGFMGNKNQGNQGNGQQAGQQQQNQVQPSTLPGGNNNAGNAIVPGAAPGQQNAQSQADKSAPQNLDKQAEQFDPSKIWEAPEAGKVNPGKFSRPKLDAAKLREGVGKMQFTQGLDPQLVAKALGGDTESFMSVLDSVARNSFMTNFQASDAYHGQMLDSYDRTVDARIPQEIGRRETQQLMEQSFQGLDNPEVAPMLKDITEKFQRTYPDASPAQIAEAAKKYLLNAANLITGQSESGGNKSQGQGNQRAQQSGAITDFSNFDSQQSGMLQ